MSELVTWGLSECISTRHHEQVGTLIRIGWDEAVLFHRMKCGGKVSAVAVFKCQSEYYNQIHTKRRSNGCYFHYKYSTLASAARLWWGRYPGARCKEVQARALFSFRYTTKSYDRHPHRNSDVQWPFFGWTCICHWTDAKFRKLVLVTMERVITSRLLCVLM